MSNRKPRRLRISCFANLKNALSERCQKHHCPKTEQRAHELFAAYADKGSFPLIVLHYGNLKHSSWKIVKQHPADTLPMSANSFLNTQDASDFIARSRADTIARAKHPVGWDELVRSGASEPILKVEEDPLEWCPIRDLANDYDSYMKYHGDPRRAVRILVPHERLRHERMLAKYA